MNNRFDDRNRQGYPDEAGYPASAGYPAPQGYSDQTGYPLRQGYPAPQGYSDEAGYPAPAEYPTSRQNYSPARAHGRTPVPARTYAADQTQLMPRTQRRQMPAAAPAPQYAPAPAPQYASDYAPQTAPQYAPQPQSQYAPQPAPAQRAYRQRPLQRFQIPQSPQRARTDASDLEPSRARGVQTFLLSQAYLFAFVLRVIAFIARVYAWLFAAAMCASACSFGPFRGFMLQFVFWISKCLPNPFFGLFVWETPFGGMLRGDFILMAFVLIMIDWICTRRAYALKNGC